MITITGVTKRFTARSGDRLAVDDLSFGITSGRVTGFVGPNGAGKSTTMRIMVGLTRPDRGTVRYDGIEHHDLRHPARVVGSVLDARCMHPGRTARDHLRSMMALGSIATRRVDDVLGEVGLDTVADRRAGGFSLGMRQRLALAGALLDEPDVLLLDEPSNGLDPEGIRWLRTRLTGFAAAGGTVFISSHLIGELAIFADDLVVVGAGRLLAVESVDVITRRVDHAVIVVTPQTAELAELLMAERFDVTVEMGDLRDLVERGAVHVQVAVDRPLPFGCARNRHPFPAVLRRRAAAGHRVRSRLPGDPGGCAHPPAERARVRRVCSPGMGPRRDRPPPTRHRLID